MLDRHLRVRTAPAALKENIVLFKDYRITVLADRLFRIEKDAAHRFIDEATQTVWFRNAPKNSFVSEISDDKAVIRTERATLAITENLEDAYVFLEDGSRVFLKDEKNLLGTYRTLDGCNGDRVIWWDRETLCSSPVRLEKGVASQNGVAVIDDSKSVVFDENGLFKERPCEETDLYVFAFGHDYQGAVAALYAICGTTPLVPRFALGNWWSRYHDYSQKEYTHLMENFERDDVPFTVATVDMDWHWSYSLDRAKHISEDGKNDEFHGWANGWTGYSWNTGLFPDHRAFLKKLHDMGLKVTLNLHPADGVRYFEDMYPEFAKAMGKDPSTEEKIPFDLTDDNYINAYFNVIHKPYEHEGVDFWWIDWQQGNHTKVKGLDPLFALNHYHTMDSGKEHMPLILSRYCGIGSHRYPLGFSGDTHVTWETMQYLPYFTATASNVGYSWWSHDIGGHMAGGKDNELNVRFVQFGVFSPINRLHCSNSVTFTKEPGAYKNGTGKIIEEFLRLRHRMIPFLYSAAYETRDKAIPLIEPMYWQYPEKEEAYKARDQYMFGKNFLVAPVIRKSKEYGMSETNVWLPEGKWTDLFTGDIHKGGKMIKAVRYLDSIPVFAREGSFFVLDSRRHGNHTDNPEKVEVMIFNGDGEYVLHEDTEGTRFNTFFSSEMISGNTLKLSIKATEEVKGVYKKDRSFLLLFKNIAYGDVTLLKNNVLQDALTDDNGCLSVEILDVRAGDEFEIEVRFEENFEAELTAALLREITFFECDTRTKDELSGKILRSRPREFEKIIEEAELPMIFERRLKEVLDV